MAVVMKYFAKQQPVAVTSVLYSTVHSNKFIVILGPHFLSAITHSEIADEAGQSAFGLLQFYSVLRLPCASYLCIAAVSSF